MIEFINKFMENRKKKSLENAIKLLCNKKTNKENRLVAIEKLEEEAKTNDEALRGLIKRFNFNIEHSILDNKEKEHVQKIIMSHKERAIPLLHENLEKDFNISWTIQTLNKLGIGDVVPALLSVINYEDLSFAKDKLEKNLEILTMLRDYKHPEIYDKTKEFLDNHDERIRFATLELLAIQDPSRASQDLAIYITDETVENLRLQNRVIKLYHENQWKIPNHKQFKGGKIKDGIYIDNKGHINFVNEY